MSKNKEMFFLYAKEAYGCGYLIMWLVCLVVMMFVAPTLANAFIQMTLIFLAIALFTLSFLKNKEVDQSFIIWMNVPFGFVAFFRTMYLFTQENMSIVNSTVVAHLQWEGASRFLSIFGISIGISLLILKKEGRTKVAFLFYHLLGVGILVFVMNLSNWFPQANTVLFENLRLTLTVAYIISLTVLWVGLYVRKKMFTWQLNTGLLVAISLLWFGECIGFPMPTVSILRSNIAELIDILAYFTLFLVLLSEAVYKPFLSDENGKSITHLQAGVSQDLNWESPTRDILTATYTHSHIMELLELQVSKSKAEEYPLAIMLLDVDELHKINEQYGHICGDHVLRELSDIMLLNVRELDWIGRYGGETFLIILNHCSLLNAFFIAEKIRVTTETFNFDRHIKVTISAGIAELTGESAQELIDKAKDFLNNAKVSGRNQIKGI